MADRVELAHQSYAAYESGDRVLIESLLSDDSEFSSPPALFAEE